MEGGGVYFRWEGRLWQEQADGSYLVWNEEAHVWERSVTQPPPQPGESRATKECPNCGRRVKATLRFCPFCEYGFEDRLGRPAPVSPTAPIRQRRNVSQGALLAVFALVLAATVGGVFLFQRDRACDNWRSAVDEITQAKIDLQGLPAGMTEEELHELNEDLLADKRPGGCE